MASKKIRWTNIALSDKLDILDFWIERNKSKVYSQKLSHLIDEAIQQIAEFPDHGKNTDIEGIRIKLLRTYLIYYLVDKEELVIIRIWDSRRDPKKLML